MLNITPVSKDGHITMRRDISLTQNLITELEELKELIYAIKRGVIFTNLKEQTYDEVFKCIIWCWKLAEWKEESGNYYLIPGRLLNLYAEVEEANGCIEDRLYLVLDLDEMDDDSDWIITNYDDKYEGFEGAELFDIFLARLEDGEL